MKDYTVSYGQSIFDVAVMHYGEISGVWDLIDDNNFVDGLDTTIQGGQILKIRDGDGFTANTITEYFNLYPAVVNNSDFDSPITGRLSLVLVEIGNENNGSDGYIIIDVVGGKPDYFFEWKKEGSDVAISHSQNLVAQSAGTYSVTVADADGNEAILSNLVISVIDNTVYIVDDNNNNIVDDDGNFMKE